MYCSERETMFRSIIKGLNSIGGVLKIPRSQSDSSKESTEDCNDLKSSLPGLYSSQLFSLHILKYLHSSIQP